MERRRQSQLLRGQEEINRLNRNFEGGRHGMLTPRSFHRIGKLGKGAFGVVDKYKSAKTGKVYAAKIVEVKNLIQEKMTEQFLKEINILMKCDHPNIVKLYAAFEYDGKIYLIMEYASRGNLYNHLKKSSKKKFSEETVVTYFRDILAAFEYLHSKDPAIIHRDLKPENILIDENWRLKIADFGWSREQQNERTTFCGTPDYLAPEMIDGSVQTEKLDIWTMGVLMYELLHGKPPFAVERKLNPMDKIKTIQKNIKKGVIKFNEDVSEEAETVIRWMLSPDPDDRPIAIQILTQPFFTKQYPILASLNVAGSHNESRITNNRSRVSANQSNVLNQGSHFEGNMEKEISLKIHTNHSEVFPNNDNPIDSNIKKKNLRDKELQALEAGRKQVEAKRLSLQNKAKALAQEKSKLEDEKKNLQSLKTQLTQKEQEIKIKETQQDNMEVDLIDRKTDIEAKEIELEKTARLLEKEKSEIQFQQEELQQRLEDLKHQEEDFQSRERLLDERAEGLDSIEVELGRREDELAEMDGIVKGREEGVLEKEQELERREKEIRQREEEIQNKEEKLKQREEELRQREEDGDSGREKQQSEVDKLQEDVELREKNVEKMELEWKEKENKLKKRESEVQKALQEMEEKEQELAAISQELVEREIDLEKKNKNPGITESQMNQIEEEHERKQEELQNELQMKTQNASKLEKQLKQKRFQIARLNTRISRLEAANNQLQLKAQKASQTGKSGSLFKKKKIGISEEDLQRWEKQEKKQPQVAMQFNGRGSFGVQKGQGVVKVEGSSPSKPKSNSTPGQQIPREKKNSKNPKNEKPREILKSDKKPDYEAPRRSQNLKKMRGALLNRKNNTQTTKDKPAEKKKNFEQYQPQQTGKYGGVIMENEEFANIGLSDNAAIIAKQEKIIQELNDQLNKASIVSLEKSGLLPNLNNTQGLGIDFQKASHKLLSIIDYTDNILKTKRQTDPESEKHKPEVFDKIENIKKSLIDFQGQLNEINPNDQTNFEFNVSNNLGTSPYKNVNVTQNPSNLTKFDYSTDSINPSALGLTNNAELSPIAKNILQATNRQNEGLQSQNGPSLRQELSENRPSMYLHKKSLSPLKMTRKIQERYIPRAPQTKKNPTKSISSMLTPTENQIPSSHQDYPTIVIQKNIKLDDQIDYFEPSNLLTKKKESEAMKGNMRFTNQQNSVKTHLRPKLDSYEERKSDYATEEQPKNSFQNSVEGNRNVYSERGRQFGLEGYRAWGSEKVGGGLANHQRVAVVKGGSGGEVFLKLKDDGGRSGYRDASGYNPNLYPTLEASPVLEGTADQPLTISDINKNLEAGNNKGEDFFKSTEDFMKWKDTNQWRKPTPHQTQPRFPDEPHYKPKRQRNSRGLNPKTLESHDETLNTLIRGDPNRANDYQQVNLSNNEHRAHEYNHISPHSGQDRIHQYQPIGITHTEQPGSGLRDNLGGTYMHRIRGNSGRDRVELRDNFTPNYGTLESDHVRYERSWDENAREFEERQRREREAFEKFEYEQNQKRMQLQRILNKKDSS